MDALQKFIDKLREEIRANVIGTTEKGLKNLKWGSNFKDDLAVLDDLSARIAKARRIIMFAEEYLRQVELIFKAEFWLKLNFNQLGPIFGLLVELAGKLGEVQGKTAEGKDFCVVVNGTLFPAFIQTLFLDSSRGKGKIDASVVATRIQEDSYAKGKLSYFYLLDDVQIHLVESPSPVQEVREAVKYDNVLNAGELVSLLRSFDELRNPDKSFTCLALGATFVGGGTVAFECPQAKSITMKVVPASANMKGAYIVSAARVISVPQELPLEVESGTGVNSKVEV